jgi:hypothetical protein
MMAVGGRRVGEINSRNAPHGRGIRNGRTEAKMSPLITADARLIVESAKLSFVATTCEDGSPNLSPKGSVRVLDDSHIVFMDIASPQTVKNLRGDPRIEICTIDFIRRRGYRFKGVASFCEPGDPTYEWVHEWLLGLHGPGYPANVVVSVAVEQVRPVESPAYTFGGAQEADLMKSWAQAYGI